VNGGATPDYWTRAKRALARRDALLAQIIRAHPRIALRCRGEPFQTLARSIVGQQISVKAATSVWNRLAAAAPGVTPQTVLGLRRRALRGVGLSARKAEYLQDLARHFVNETIQVGRWPDLDDEAVIADLVEVRGIGRWTAEMFLVFNLLRPDVLPVGDLGLQRAVARHYLGHDGCAKAAEIQAIAENWRPWRSVATWYLWRSLEPVPVEY